VPPRRISLLHSGDDLGRGAESRWRLARRVAKVLDTMSDKKVITTVLALGIARSTLLADGWEPARAQQLSADQVSNIALAVPLQAEGDNSAVARASDTLADSLRVQGNVEAVQLDVRHKTIGYVLSALAADFNVAYQSSSALNEELNGRYAGSLGQVLSRVLDGYDYVIKRENARLSIIIFDRSGGRAVAAPSPHPVSQHRAQIRDSR
jgi:hypothetical protein